MPCMLSYHNHSFCRTFSSKVGVFSIVITTRAFDEMQNIRNDQRAHDFHFANFNWDVEIQCYMSANFTMGGKKK